MEGNNKIPMLHITEVILKFTKMERRNHDAPSIY